MKQRSARPFHAPFPLVAVIHLPPLPGAPRAHGSPGAVYDRAAREAALLGGAGVDGILVENYGDVPFHAAAVPPETVAALALAVARVRSACELPVGVNVLRNDAAAALGIAAATGASFVRVNVHTGAMLTDQGWLEGRAFETLRLRARLGLDVAILADVLVKHAVPPPDLTLEDAARDAVERGLADGLIVTGRATGRPVDAGELDTVRTAAPDTPVWIGSGLTPERVADLLAHADGAIVGSALREDGVAGRPLDPRRVAQLVAAVRAVRDRTSAREESE